VDLRYVTCVAVAGAPAKAGPTEEAGVADEKVGAAKCGRWLMFFILFQIRPAC